MNKKTIELLAPAGNYDSYRAAAAGGADAVYLGAKGFNARQYADNFSGSNLELVIEDAHIRGIRVYFVLNTLLKNSEINEALELASFVYEKGIDAIIVQDIGLVNILKKYAPDLPLHASTQMSIHNTDGVMAARNMGIERVILSRELNLKEIKSIVLNTDAEVEVFVHGALCISRSGQCLLSSFIGGRSGNRGRCAQPCRLPWETDGRSISGQYLLSPKDLMTLEILPELVNTGISALKIEGRMKSPEYVFSVVSVYRKYLDMVIQNPMKYKVEPEDISMLMRVFNRGGFTRGYFKGYSFKSIMSTDYPKHRGVLIGTTEAGIQQSQYGGQKDGMLIRIKLSERIRMGDGLEIRDPKNNNPSAILSVMLKDGRHVKSAEPGDILMVGNFKAAPAPYSKVYKTYDKALMDSLSGLIKENLQRVPVTGRFRLYTGEYPVLEVQDDEGNAVYESGNVKAQTAEKKPLTNARAGEQLKKTGDTPYFFKTLNIDTDENSFIPASEINMLRRKALDGLTEKRRNIGKRYKNILLSDVENFPGNKRNLSEIREISLFLFNVPVNISWSNIAADRVYLPVTALEQVNAAKESGKRVYIWVPPVLHDEQMDLVINRLMTVKDQTDGILTGNLGSLHRIRGACPEIPVALDFQMNVFNSWTVGAFKEYSPSSIALSVEMSMEEIQKTESADIPLEVYVYGEIPVMTMEYCPGSTKGECLRKCGSCGNRNGYIIDRTGRRFNYKTDPLLKRTTLYNSSKLMLDDTSPLKESSVGILRIGIMDESLDEISELCRFYREQWVGGVERSVLHMSETIMKMKKAGVTEGHFYRGVE